ncbi:DegV domain-containing protein YitS [Virgibacillus pantothenticus]|uniref:DegV family protein n=1 Tax=Virgibacillus pantothenticus TaxID=1473 RepID=A0A0L0QTJ3_VIRPA|nr:MULTISPECIES: DegV family protein [Virgibacillus]API91037.1 fatty acid-binding protein DegV [Virgibacillus sp. 6R]KNE22005.1 degV family protein [Virgibacillus pantothenticus]MBS7429026.1 DegV family protein [Virgibacillus sp. 19R1-5]MBU8566779.1 DegV family protein [Virgibacillus pantothenticus]MBU8600361.1 DegV family protein [Virgibacillus pantothenticus]
MNIKILADSACDLSMDYYNEFDIEMAPLTVHLDDKDYEDGKSIDPKTVYHAMRNGKTPKTSQASPRHFKAIFTSYAEANQPLVYLAFSSQLSGTYQTAKMIEQEVKEIYPEAPIHVIDTKCASLGCGLVVLHAAKLAKQGADLETIINSSRACALNMEHIFTVDDLEYLYRGGRVSRTAAFVGSLLKIKPILHVEDGKLIPLEKIRGSKKLFHRMLEIMEERGDDLSNQTIAISHGDDAERAEQLASMIKEKFHVKEVIIDMVGSAIGSHSGPGTIALFFLNNTNFQQPVQEE